MKKKIILLMLITVVFISGCSITIVKLDNIDNIINDVLLVDNKLSNASFNGYSYYIPNTLKIINKAEYNTV